MTNFGVIPGGTNADVLVNTTGNVFLPASPESFSYDADGNLTNDGRSAYTWDAENRLVKLVANAGVQALIKFEYDSGGRRVHKQVWNNNAGSGNPVTDIKFIYDGWNLVAELDTLNASTLHAPRSHAPRPRVPRSPSPCQPSRISLRQPLTRTITR